MHIPSDNNRIAPQKLTPWLPARRVRLVKSQFLDSQVICKLPKNHPKNHAPLFLLSFNYLAQTQALRFSFTQCCSPSVQSPSQDLVGYSCHHPACRGTAQALPYHFPIQHTLHTSCPHVSPCPWLALWFVAAAASLALPAKKQPRNPAHIII